ncbi:MAG: hypothetical protein OXN89_00105 [Bryobacterales bacterium]|nr:hypothetical protein [Bryobacterales bacterium]
MGWSSDLSENGSLRMVGEHPALEAAAAPSSVHAEPDKSIAGGRVSIAAAAGDHDDLSAASGVRGVAKPAALSSVSHNTSP